MMYLLLFLICVWFLVLLFVNLLATDVDEVNQAIERNNQERLMFGDSDLIGANISVGTKDVKQVIEFPSDKNIVLG